MPAAYRLYYVWSPCRRLPVLAAEVGKTLLDSLLESAERNSYEIIALAIAPEHVHLLLSLQPSHAPAQAAANLKGASANGSSGSTRTSAASSEIGSGDAATVSTRLANAAPHRPSGTSCLRRIITACRAFIGPQGDCPSATVGAPLPPTSAFSAAPERRPAASAPGRHRSPWSLRRCNRNRSPSRRESTRCQERRRRQAPDPP